MLNYILFSTSPSGEGQTAKYRTLSDAKNAVLRTGDPGSDHACYRISDGKMWRLCVNWKSRGIRAVHAVEGAFS